MVCEITPEMVDRFFGDEDGDEYVVVLGSKKDGDRLKIALEIQGEPFDTASAEVTAIFALALNIGFVAMKSGVCGVEPPHEFPIDRVTAASERLAEIATRRFVDAVRKYHKKP